MPSHTPQLGREASAPCCPLAIRPFVEQQRGCSSETVTGAVGTVLALAARESRSVSREQGALVPCQGRGSRCPALMSHARVASEELKLLRLRPSVPSTPWQPVPHWTEEDAGVVSGTHRQKGHRQAPACQQGRESRKKGTGAHPQGLVRDLAVVHSGLLSPFWAEISQVEHLRLSAWGPS